MAANRGKAIGLGLKRSPTVRQLGQSRGAWLSAYIPIAAPEDELRPKLPFPEPHYEDEKGRAWNLLRRRTSG